LVINLVAHEKGLTSSGPLSALRGREQPDNAVRLHRAEHRRCHGQLPPRVQSVLRHERRKQVRSDAYQLRVDGGDLHPISRSGARDVRIPLQPVCQLRTRHQPRDQGVGEGQLQRNVPADGEDRRQRRDCHPTVPVAALELLPGGRRNPLELRQVPPELEGPDREILSAGDLSEHDTSRDLEASERAC